MSRTVLYSQGLEDLFNERRPIDLADVSAALFAPPRAQSAIQEECQCSNCNGAEKLYGVPCGQCGTKLWGCAALGCWVSGCANSSVEVKRRVCWCSCCEGSIITDGVTCYSCGNPSSTCPSDPCICATLERIRARHRPAIMATRIQSVWRGYKTRKTIQERNAEEIAATLPIWRFYDEDYNRSVLCQSLMCELKKDDPTWDPTQTRHYQWMLKTGGPFLEECETYMLRRGWVRPQKKNIHVRFTVRALYRVMEECGVSDEDPRVLSALVKVLGRR
jgi:hypothetical protein